jgi:ribosomal 50S subunit-associated protein YjgA (DUF615 family)
MDSGDKASNKAMAVGHKYALLQLFAIPTEEQKDPEYDSHDVKPATGKPVEQSKPKEQNAAEMFSFSEMRARKEAFSAACSDASTIDELQSIVADVAPLKTKFRPSIWESMRTLAHMRERQLKSGPEIERYDEKTEAKAVDMIKQKIESLQSGAEVEKYWQDKVSPGRDRFSESGWDAICTVRNRKEQVLETAKERM